MILFSFPRSNFGLSRRRRHRRLQTLPRWTDWWRRHSWSQPHRPSLIKNLVSDRNRPKRIYKIRYCMTPVHLPRGQVYITLWVQHTCNRGSETIMQLHVDIYTYRYRYCCFGFVSRNINQNHVDSRKFAEIWIIFCSGWSKVQLFKICSVGSVCNLDCQLLSRNYLLILLNLTLT